MNERIKELAEQAGEYVNAVYTPPVRSKTPDKIWEDGHVDWHTQFNQKFAELLIRECMDIVRDINQEYDGGSTVVNAAEEIREYFGVKE
jgi:hypothetical protein